MPTYKAIVGNIVDGEFEPEGQTATLGAETDETAIKLMWEWVHTLSGLFPITHVRLTEMITFMKRKPIGKWPISESPYNKEKEATDGS